LFLCSVIETFLSAQQYNKSEWAYLIMGVVGAAVVGALPPCEAILTAQIVANFYTVEAADMRDANLPWSLGFLALAGASLIGNTMVGVAFSICGYRLTRRLRTLAFEAIVRRNVGWFDFPEHSTGELTTRLEADAEAVAKVTGWQLGYRIRIFSSLAAGVVIALVYTWQIGVIAIACVPLIMGASVVQALCLSKRFVKEHEGLSPATILEQGLRGITAVQAYNLQGRVGDDYSTALQPEVKGKVKLGFISGAVYGFSQFAIFVSFALVFFVGSKLLLEQGLLFVDFFTSILAVMFGAIGVGQVNADFKAQQDGRAAAARIFAIADEPLDEMDPFSEKGEKLSSLDGSIAFESCYFNYPSRPNKPSTFEPSTELFLFSLFILTNFLFLRLQSTTKLKRMMDLQFRSNLKSQSRLLDR
jgi:ABC-type multidrug transport system fused ATPase/permease subunit